MIHADISVDKIDWPLDRRIGRNTIDKDTYITVSRSKCFIRFERERGAWRERMGGYEKEADLYLKVARDIRWEEIRRD